MQITVNIPDELAAQAQERGMTPERFIEGLIEDAARPNPLASKRRTRNMKAFFKAMAAYSEKIPQLPDEAFTRESFYQDHD